MTNELNRVHQAEAKEKDNCTPKWVRKTKTDDLESGVEWIYAGLFSNASIWRENGRVLSCVCPLLPDTGKAREFHRLIVIVLKMEPMD